ncbi:MULTISPECIES: glucose 1-dehydrogenase [unclassified Chelatococcus]|uniref:SDR family NAD(P)-dependent oxidoreductase n=1 Tax=unclassified Chelatococcus TaxID=2638111 RepID=UPI001BCBAE0E|nr:MULTISPECIES: glucose 1-dehydrogenase [unclassified Chelatococcus]MBS7700116.1 glucose 1-dehydrogenase [Chelatococcus sp. YT9]MBX3556809.1 glucose 1-dehydrogenase [Chelatococcus sp.]
MNDLFSLKGRTAVVTGAGRGLGAAIATALSDAGARVVLIGRKREPLEEVSAAISGAGGETSVEVCDVTDADAIASTMKTITLRYGRIDILVNNAGISHRAEFSEVSEAAWDELMAVNLKGPFLATRAVLPGMIERRAGKIINIVSVVGELGRPFIVPYSTSKGGLRMMTRALATEVAEHNVQVNGIGPGYFVTDMNRPIMDDAPLYQSRVSRVPARRWGDPEELGGTAVFLASRASDYVNGQVIYVDGGLSSSF